MERRNFVKMCGALPLLTIFKGPKYFGLADEKRSLATNDQTNVLKIIEDVTPGQLVMMSGRPSMGKSMVALNLMNELVSVQSNSCAYFSIEMTKENLMRRWLLLTSDSSFKPVKNGIPSMTDFGHFAQASHAYTKASFYVNDDSRITTESISEQIRSLKKSNVDVKFVFIDYVQLIQSRHTHLSRCDQVANTLGQLKAIAIEENVIVIGLGQLNRGTEGRPDKRPRSTDFRETNDLSSIDKLILLYRDDYYDEQLQVLRSELEFLIYRGHIKSSINYKGLLSQSTFKITNVSTFFKSRLS